MLSFYVILIANEDQTFLYSKYIILIEWLFLDKRIIYQWTRCAIAGASSIAVLLAVEAIKDNPLITNLNS